MAYFGNGQKVSGNNTVQATLPSQATVGTAEVRLDVYTHHELLKPDTRETSPFGPYAACTRSQS